VRNLCVLLSVVFVIALSLSAFARDARLDRLVNQGTVTEEQIAAAEMEGPSNWMAAKAYDVYISGYAQVQWWYADGADPNNAFDLNRVRLKVNGMLSESWGFVIQTEFAGEVGLRTVGVWYQYGDGKVFLGQNKVPLVLENITSGSKLDTINRSEIARQLDDRDIGLFVDYAFLEGKVGVQASVTNGTGTNATEVNDDKDYTLRVEAMPFKGSEGPADSLLFAGAYSMGDQQELDIDEIDLGDYSRTIYVGTVQWTYNKVLKLQGEYVNIEQDLAAGGSTTTDGWYVLATYDLPVDSMVVTPLAKYEELSPDLGTGGDWVTLGVRISFIGTHDLKLDVNYVIESLDVGEDQDEFILQLQASF
jgi:hypothetical protein